jgi:hypothetical protein
MNKFKAFLPLFIAIILNSTGFAAESGSEENAAEDSFYVTDEDLDVIKDLVLANYDPTSRIKWTDITAEFVEQNAERCEGFSDAYLRQRISRRFSNIFLNLHGSRRGEWAGLIAPKKADAPKRQKDEEKPDVMVVKRPKNILLESKPQASEERASAPAPNARKIAFDWTEEEIDGLRDMALADLVSSKRQRLNYDEVAKAFIERFETKCSDLEEDALVALVKKKFTGLFLGGSRTAEWKELRIQNNVKVATDPRKKRNTEKLAEENEDADIQDEQAADQNPAEAKKPALEKAKVEPVVVAVVPSVAAQEVIPAQAAAPKKLNSLILSVLNMNNDDKFMTTYLLAVKAGQQCVTCMQDGAEVPTLLVVLKKQRLELFKRLVQLDVNLASLGLPCAGGKILKDILTDHILAHQHYGVLDDLLGGSVATHAFLTDAFVSGRISKEDFVAQIPQARLSALVQARFVAAVNASNEAEIEFWFSCGLVDWSTEIAMENNSHDGKL